MINIYDGNNVMLRSMTNAPVPGQLKLSIRQRLASATPTDIWVWDGPKHNARRQEIYPPYKMNRQPMAEDMFAQIKLFKDLLVHTSAAQITVDGWEADDVIATLAKTWSLPITIHTNDADYFQLLRQPNVTLKGPKKTPFDPRWTCLYKALVGDSSDNIAGISGFGPKAWDKTEGFREELETAIRVGSPHSFHALPLPTPLLRWLALPDAIPTLQSMFLITHMWDVPLEDINAGTTTGTPDQALIDSTLRRFFL